MTQNDGDFFLMLHVRCEFAAALLQAVGMLWLSSLCLFCSGSKLKEQPVFGAYCSHHLMSEDKEQESWHKDRMAPFRHGVWPINFHVICQSKSPVQSLLSGSMKCTSFIGTTTNHMVIGKGE